MRGYQYNKSFSTSVSPPVIYGFPTSQPTRSLLMLCKQANIDVKYVEINVFKGQHKTIEFLKVNPAGLIPAWEEKDDGKHFSLGEVSNVTVS